MNNLPDINKEFFEAFIKPVIDKELEATPEGMRLNVNIVVDVEKGLHLEFTRTPMEESE